jgi:cytochrome P450
MTEIAQAPPMGPWKEQLRLMRNDRIGGLRRFNETNGDIGRFGMIFGSVVLVNTPDLVRDVLVTNAKAFEKSPVLRGALHPLAGQGLFTSEGELWRRQRKLMAPMFQQTMIANFARDMTQAAERAAGTWGDGEVVDVAREMTRITMAVAGKTLFDADTFTEAGELGAALTTALEWAATQSSSTTMIVQARASVGLDRLADHLPALLRVPARRLAARAMVPIRWPGERTRALEAALAVLEGRVARMIAERRASPEAKHDLLSLLLRARDEDEGGATMSDRQVRDEVLTLFVAGHETTANALAWALMLLAQHPEWYARVRDEALALPGSPTFADLPRLAVGARVFKESLRLYPPVYMFGRVAVADTQLGPYHVPKGTVVLVSPFALHHRAEFWPDPERFDPDRFTPAEEARRHKTAFIPFSAGPRTCIGNHFALMEGPLVLATLLQRADFALVDPQGAVPEPTATLRPKGGIPMRVALRRAKTRFVTSSSSRAPS